MTLEKSKQLLDEEYERAKRLDYVKKPLAYALFQVWKKADKDICVDVVEKRILPIYAVRTIHKDYQNKTHIEYIKENIAKDLAKYLLQEGFIHFSEDTEGEAITICGLFNIVDERSKNGKS